MNYQVLKGLKVGNLESVDKCIIPTCNIMGVDIAAINMEWLIEYTKENINHLSGNYMCVANVHTTVTAYEDIDYRDIQNGGIMAIPDGGPLSSVGRRRGYSSMQRTTGPSYMEEVFKISEEYGWRHFFYGSSQETLDKLKEELIKKYPYMQIVGMYSPPFKKEVTVESDDILSMVNDAKPNFVWVGLGAPKQEKWMALYKDKVHGFMVGVGAGFDYFAGNIKRAPEWMQKCNLEWLYRLIQDPKRLFKRYFSTNIKFIWNAVIMGK